MAVRTSFSFSPWTCGPGKSRNPRDVLSETPGKDVSLMNEPSAMRTHASLLMRLRQSDQDQAAWNAFVDRYGPQIFAWCRHWGLQDTDAEDVTQTVLLKLAEKLRGFEYDPSRRF